MTTRDPETPDSAPERVDPGTTGLGADDAPGWHASWARIAVALVLAGQGMSFSLAVNMSPPDSPAIYWVLHGGLAASAVAVLALLGGPLLRECVSTLRARRITVDLLFAVTMVGSLAASVFSSLRGEGPIFYELVAILLAIYTTGKMLGARSRARALRAVDALRAEHDVCVVLDEAGARHRVRSAEVAVGARVLVGPGEALGVDGVVIRGEGYVATTPLTGEPEPRLCAAGDTVLAGMRSVDAVFEVRTTAAGGHRRLDSMLSALEDARVRPSRIQAAADRLAERFVPVVITASLLTGAFWWWHAGVVAAVENGLAVLVVACPCALGLATPLGVWAGLVGLGRLGIVARSGDFIEALAGCDRALFDKTGTLCDPQLKVAAFHVAECAPLDGAALRAAVAAAELGVDHPVAEALRRASAEPNEGVAEYTAREARIVPGRGLRAKIVHEVSGAEHEVVAGSELLMRDCAISGFEEGTRAGRRQVWVAIDGRLAATIQLDEQPRERAGEAFAGLGRLGLQVEILTGDPEFRDELWPGIPRRTGLSPEEKADRVRELQAGGLRVLFVGDGLNDAPALAAADASIAIRQGAELALSNALAVVASESLGTLPDAVRLARGVVRAIRSNIRFSAIYNTAGMAIAAVGWLHPVLAALLMAGSSLIVSARVLRAGSVVNQTASNAPAR